MISSTIRAGRAADRSDSQSATQSGHDARVPFANRFQSLRRRLSPMALAERVILQRPHHSERPQLFILGLPRSGTTLTYQYLVHRLQVAYFSNAVGTWPDAPCLATWLQRRHHHDYRSDFRSDYGKVAGAVAPREAGAFWARFFSLEDYVGAHEIDPETAEQLRRSVACVQGLYGDLPFVNKNVKHMLRVKALAEIFPRARFLVVERARADVALSLLRGRFAGDRDPAAWLSVRPPDYAELRNLSLPQQVAGQLSSLERQLALDLAALPPERCLHLDYAAFCSRPELAVELVSDALGAPASKNPPVASFERACNRPENDLEAELLACLDT